jgi:hypothetical protein
MTWCDGDPSRCKVISFVGVCVTGVAFFIVIIVGMTILGTPYDFENLPYFTDTQCTPVAVTVAKMADCDSVTTDGGATVYYTEYVAVWKCKETGASILENPFTGKRQESIAQNNANDYPLNIIQNVSCNSVNLPINYPGWINFHACQVWNTCFFDTDMIHELQNNALYRYNQGYHLLYASAGIGGLCLIFIIIFTVDMYKCCSSRYTEYP